MSWTGFWPQHEIARRELELEVQNLVGPIVNINSLTIPQLLGMRDRELRRRDLGIKHLGDPVL